jgi:hypothetical protein
MKTIFIDKLPIPIRWILCFPAAIVSASVASFLIALLSNLSFAYGFGMWEETLVKMIFREFLASVCAGGVFVFIGARIVPNHRMVVGLTLFGLIVFLSGGSITLKIIYGEHLSTQWLPLLLSTVGVLLGGGVTVNAIHMGQMEGMWTDQEPQKKVWPARDGEQTFYSQQKAVLGLQQRYASAKSMDELLAALGEGIFEGAFAICNDPAIKQNVKRNKYAEIKRRVLLESIAIAVNTLRPKLSEVFIGMSPDPLFDAVGNYIAASFLSHIGSGEDTLQSCTTLIRNTIEERRLTRNGIDACTNETRLLEAFGGKLTDRGVIMNPSSVPMELMLIAHNIAERGISVYLGDFIKRRKVLLYGEEPQVAKPSQEEIERSRREQLAKIEAEFQRLLAEEDGMIGNDAIIDAYRKIIHYPKARHRVGMLYYDYGCYYGAKAELEEAKRLDPSLAEDKLLVELKGIVQELDVLKPSGFVPKGSVWDYGVVPEQLKDGAVIDDFPVNDTLIGDIRAISLKNPEAWKNDKVVDGEGDESDVMWYRFKTLLYRKGEDFPFTVVMLESSLAGTSCITGTNLETDERQNYGPAYKGMCYEEFKYKVILIGKFGNIDNDGQAPR